MLNRGNAKNEPRAMMMSSPDDFAPPAHRSFSPEALNFAQNWVEMEQSLQAQRIESEQWRMRALDAEAEVKRLKQRLEDERVDNEDRLARLAEASGRETAMLTEQREYWRGQYTRVETNLHTAGKIILSCLNESIPAKAVNTAGLSAVADAIEQPTVSDDEAAKTVKRATAEIEQALLTRTSEQ
jgi:hypothetical protein